MHHQSPKQQTYPNHSRGEHARAGCALLEATVEVAPIATIFKAHGDVEHSIASQNSAKRGCHVAWVIHVAHVSPRNREGRACIVSYHH